MAPVFNDVNEWLNENKKCFRPPICNKMMYDSVELKVFFVGGPNSRKDFHLEEGEEFFYQIKGDMNLIVVEKGEFRNIIIKEGEVFLLPGRIPHSPQRKENTIGLVVERERSVHEMDCLRYYVENSKDILYEKWFHCRSLGTQLPPIINEYFCSEQYRTGKPIPGTILDKKPVIEDCFTELQNPFYLRKWIQHHRQELESETRMDLFVGDYSSRIKILAKGNHRNEPNLPETLLLQLEGNSRILAGSQKYDLLEECTLLLNPREEWTMKNDGLTLSIVMSSMKVTM